MISRKDVAAGYKAGHIRLGVSPNGDGIVCFIGDGWFYFGGETAERYSNVKAFRQDVTEDVILKDIYGVLEAFAASKDGELEYAYYDSYLHENIPMEDGAAAAKREINTRDTATSIVDIFRHTLEEEGFAFPDPDGADWDPETGSPFYGKPYDTLVNRVEMGLAFLLSRYAPGPEVIKNQVVRPNSIKEAIKALPSFQTVPAVKVSVKALYEKFGHELAMSNIQIEPAHDGETETYLLRNDDGELAAYDGDNCFVVEAGNVTLTLHSEEDGEDGSTVYFCLTWDEAEAAVNLLNEKEEGPAMRNGWPQRDIERALARIRETEPEADQERAMEILQNFGYQPGGDVDAIIDRWEDDPGY